MSGRRKTTVTVEYIIRFKEHGRLSAELSFDAETQTCQTITYWPNGRIHRVETGSIDDVIAALKAVVRDRPAPGPADDCPRDGT